MIDSIGSKARFRSYNFQNNFRMTIVTFYLNYTKAASERSGGLLAITGSDNGIKIYIYMALIWPQRNMTKDITRKSICQNAHFKWINDNIIMSKSTSIVRCSYIVLHEKSSWSTLSKCISLPKIFLFYFRIALKFMILIFVLPFSIDVTPTLSNIYFRYDNACVPH